MTSLRSGPPSPVFVIAALSVGAADVLLGRFSNGAQWADRLGSLLVVLLVVVAPDVFYEGTGGWVREVQTILICLMALLLLWFLFGSGEPTRKPGP